MEINFEKKAGSEFAGCVFRWEFAFQLKVNLSDGFAIQTVPVEWALDGPVIGPLL